MHRTQDMQTRATTMTRMARRLIGLELLLLACTIPLLSQRASSDQDRFGSWFKYQLSPNFLYRDAVMLEFTIDCDIKVDDLTLAELQGLSLSKVLTEVI